MDILEQMQPLSETPLPDVWIQVERDLVQAALEGDGQAFATLVRPHLSLLHRIALRACGNSSLAEDAVQETLTIAYQKLGRYQPGTSFKAHLAAIAVRRAHTLLRSETRRSRHEAALEPPLPQARADVLVDVASSTHKVRQALGAMPKKRREAALLRLDGGLSFSEIGSVLGTSEGSARVLVHLAIKELRGHLADLLESSVDNAGYGHGGRTVQKDLIA